MGCFTYTCSLSGLPITWNDKVVYLALAPGEHHCGIGPLHAWVPATVPIRGRYNDYGSIEKLERKPVTKVFFDTLARRAIPRAVGENSVHDVAITPDNMTREEWLMALLEERVQFKDQFRGTVTLVQAMIRQEVWDFLVRFTSKRLKDLRPEAVGHGLYMFSGLDRKSLNDAESERGRFEIFCVNGTLAWLGRPWMRGSSCGPQFAAWRCQLEFLDLLKQSVQKYIDRYEEENGEPYVDDE